MPQLPPSRRRTFRRRQAAAPILPIAWSSISPLPACLPPWKSQRRPKEPTRPPEQLRPARAAAALRPAAEDLALRPWGGAAPPALLRAGAGPPPTAPAARREGANEYRSPPGHRAHHRADRCRAPFARRIFVFGLDDHAP